MYNYICPPVYLCENKCAQRLAVYLCCTRCADDRYADVSRGSSQAYHAASHIRL